MNTLLARLLLIVSIALVPALGFQAYSENQARQIRKQLVQDEALRLVRLVGTEQQRIIEGAAQVLDTISGAPSVQDNMAEHCQRLLANLIQQSPRYNAVAVIGLDGHILCSPVPVDPALDLSDRPHFLRALHTGGTVIGDYAIGRVSGMPSLHVARPFRDRNGVVAGVVDLAINLEWLQRQLERVPLPPSATAMIADRNGIMLARRPEPADFVGKPILAEHRFMLEGTQAAIAAMKSRTGNSILAAYSPPGAEPTGLLVKVSLDRDITFAGMAQENRTGLMLIFAGGALALALTALLGARLIRRPVGRLLAAARSWRAGDLSARTGLGTERSEFGRLAVAFDAMAAALASREQALHTALESTTDSVIVMDRAWRITYVSERAKAHVAKGLDLVGQTVWDAFPSTSDSIFAAGYRQAMETGVPVHTVGYSPTFDTWFSAHAYPSADGLTAFFRDITEERRAAAALKQSDDLFQAIFDQAAVGMAMLALDGRWIRVNEKLCTIVGYSREEMLARTYQDLTPADHAEADRAVAQALIKGEATSGRIEKRYVRKDERVVWVNVTVSLLRDAEGRPERFIAVIEDITERKNVEAALRESEARLQLAREAAGFGVWEWDPVTGKVTWSDEQWRLHGYDGPGAEDPSTETWLRNMHPQDRERVLTEQLAMFAEPNATYDSDYRVIGPGGEIRWLLARGMVVCDAQGRPTHMVGLNMDVTASQETEAALVRLTNELEARVSEEIAAREAAQARATHAERLQVLGQLAGGIAHDFNNVLQGIAGAATLIDRHPEDASGVRRLARLALAATERGASITGRLLTFGRRAELHAETLDTADLLCGLREMLSHTLGTSIGVNVRLTSNLPPLLADKGQLETVLLNLATNARDAMPEGGPLTLSAATEMVGQDASGHQAGLAPGRYVRLTVTDTGMGMDADTLARASEPFFTTKQHGAGTGLGLAMARGFAEQSGGALGIHSTPGKGTTVTLWLPAADSDRRRETPEDPAPGTDTAMRSARVLLVDDEELVREVVAECLRDAGFDVRVVADGTEALALLDAGEAVDLLVTDMSMPKMDGLAVIAAAHARRPGLPAVLLTGHTSDDRILAAGGAVSGDFTLLRKPVTGRQLIGCLRGLLAARVEADLDVC